MPPEVTLGSRATPSSTQSPRPPGRRLVLCLDGTWNIESDFTNIWRLNIALKKNNDQLVYYDQGVGTKPTDFITGGAFGRGLSKDVLEAYLWLTEHHQDGDDIFVFGFSRGAYTARSLVGFLSVCGLLRVDAPENIKAAYELYRIPGMGRDSPCAEHFRRCNSREGRYEDELRVKFLGVFDTVGALGLPVYEMPMFENEAWHKVYLSEIVDHAYHALAIDEHRELFDACLWNNRHADNETVEQRWFVGAHADVGGGYGEAALSIRPLEWMQSVASAHGLDFDPPPVRLDQYDYDRAPVHDSFSEFLGGTYALGRRYRRFYRKIGQQAYWDPGRLVDEPSTLKALLTKGREAAGKLLQRSGLRRPPEPVPLGICQWLEPTVERRVHQNPSYRPPNLQAFFPADVWAT